MSTNSRRGVEWPIMFSTEDHFDELNEVEDLLFYETIRKNQRVAVDIHKGNPLV